MRKNFVSFSILVMISLSAMAQDSSKKKEPAMNIKQFWLVMIKTGPKQDFDSLTKARLFEGHFSNMTRLHKEGILKVAGPFGKNDFQWRGLFIYDCPTLEEAKKQAETDPAVAAGIFAVDIVPWFTEPSGSFKPFAQEKEKRKAPDRKVVKRNK